MFKLRKTCALLCSGMCALGTGASAENPGRLNMKGGMKANSSAGLNPESMKFMDKYQAELDNFLDSQRREAEEAKSKSAPIGAETVLLYGGYFGKTKESVWARGKLSALDDPKVLENFRKLELDFFESKTKGKKLNSHLVYWLCRWVLSHVVTGGMTATSFGIFGCLHLTAIGRVKQYLLGNKIEEHLVLGAGSIPISPQNEDSDGVKRAKEYANSELGLAAVARRLALVPLILLAIPVAGGFNYLSQKQWGQGLEFEALAEKIKEVKESIEKDAEANKQKLKNNSVKKIGNIKSNRNKRMRRRRKRNLPNLTNIPNLKQNLASN